MPQPNSVNRPIPSSVPAVTKKDYLSLANLVKGKDGIQRVHKKSPQTESLRTTGELYESRDFVAAYECFRPVYDKVVSDMQRILARNMEFEANKLAQQQQKPLAAAKESIQKMKAYAQQMIDQFDRLRHDLESKSLVRVHIQKGCSPTDPATSPADGAAPTALRSANETRLAPNTIPPVELVRGEKRFRKAPYTPPEKGNVYAVRDKGKVERIIRVIGTSLDGTRVQVEVLEDGNSSNPPVELAVESLARQASKGWCSLLVPIVAKGDERNTAREPAASTATATATIKLDIQNFGRCSADITRANIKFDTQLIKDVGDGPFRAGNYEQAFLTFEQYAIGFTSAVASSRQAIAEGRRALTAEKGKLSGKEIQDRTAAFIRNEQLIQTAQRAFSTILEGLRMYLRARQR